MTVLRNVTRDQLEQMNSIDEICSAVAGIAGTPADETIEGRFISGWTNAMDMVDSGEIVKGDFKTFRRFALSEVRNYF